MRPATACRHPLRPHFEHHYTFLITVRGGWGADSLGRSLAWLSAARPRSTLVHSLLSSSRLRHWWQRLQSQLYTTEATVRVQLRMPREVLLRGTQNARSRCCCGCAPRAIPLHTSVVLLARLSLRCAERYIMHSKIILFLSLESSFAWAPLAPYERFYYPEQHVRRYHALCGCFISQARACAAA